MFDHQAGFADGLGGVDPVPAGAGGQLLLWVEENGAVHSLAGGAGLPFPVFGDGTGSRSMSAMTSRARLGCSVAGVCISRPQDQPMVARSSLAVSDGVLPTLTPTASSASFLAWAVPAEPETMAPAWPMVLPSGAVNPATYPTTGLETLSAMNAAARSSASPPISPIITIAAVSSSVSNASRASMWVVPMIGSPPMPIAVENPRSRSSYIIW